VEYQAIFYRELSDYSRSSAKVLVPKLLAKFSPKSVVDFGCGSGEFLEEFKKNNVSEILGLDGRWLPQQSRGDWFQEVDLQRTIDLKVKYDMALCLEVAEHLPIAFAEVLVDSLARASDRIVFSAAIPGQGGTNHVNEQFPEFWADLFLKRGFKLEWDPRIEIWSNRRIAPWYRQNLIVYRKYHSPQLTPEYPALLHHPEIFPEFQNFSQRVFGLLHRVLSRFRRLWWNKNH
jgi:SAM-dependent methyltransferase